MSRNTFAVGVMTSLCGAWLVSGHLLPTLFAASGNQVDYPQGYR